jgi:hypothetical protein
MLHSCADRSNACRLGISAPLSTTFPQKVWKTVGPLRSSRGSVTLVLLIALILGPTATARALEATVFLSTASPGEAWGQGLGASLASTWFKVVMLDAELARQGYETADGKLLSFSVAACLAPSFGRLTPYAGLGFGLQRQELGGFSDNGTLTSLMVGAKVNLGLLVLRAEYRTFELSGTPLVPLDYRFYAGAGISF